MSPGRELDRLVAEKIFGHEVIEERWGKDNQFRSLTIGTPDYYDVAGEMRLFNSLPAYSLDIAETWRIVEKLPHVFELTTNAPQPTTSETSWLASFAAEPPSCGETAPHAICLAALRVAGVEIG